MIFARKMPEFYMIVARKLFSRILGGRARASLLARLLRLSQRTVFVEDVVIFVAESRTPLPSSADTASPGTDSGSDHQPRRGARRFSLRLRRTNERTFSRQTHGPSINLDDRGCIVLTPSERIHSEAPPASVTTCSLNATNASRRDRVVRVLQATLSRRRDLRLTAL